MALTPAEKQRRYRERQKDKRAAERRAPAPEADLAVENPSRSFSEFLKERENNLYFFETLAWAGVSIDGDLLEEDHDFELRQRWEEDGLPVNSLTRATAMVGCLTAAAKDLAELINEYKLEEIDRQMPKASPVLKLRLEQLRKWLTKRTSHFFPVIEVKDDR